MSTIAQKLTTPRKRAAFLHYMDDLDAFAGVTNNLDKFKDVEALLEQASKLLAELHEDAGKDMLHIASHMGDLQGAIKIKAITYAIENGAEHVYPVR